MVVEADVAAMVASELAAVVQLPTEARRCGPVARESGRAGAVRASIDHGLGGGGPDGPDSTRACFHAVEPGRGITVCRQSTAAFPAAGDWRALSPEIWELRCPMCLEIAPVERRQPRRYQFGVTPPRRMTTWWACGFSRRHDWGGSGALLVFVWASICAFAAALVLIAIWTVTAWDIIAAVAAVTAATALVPLLVNWAERCEGTFFGPDGITLRQAVRAFLPGSSMAFRTFLPWSAVQSFAIVDLSGYEGEDRWHVCIVTTDRRRVLIPGLPSGWASEDDARPRVLIPGLPPPWASEVEARRAAAKLNVAFGLEWEAMHFPPVMVYDGIGGAVPKSTEKMSGALQVAMVVVMAIPEIVWSGSVTRRSAGRRTGY